MDNDKTPLLSNQKNQPFLNLIDINDINDNYTFEKTLAIKRLTAKKVVFDRNDSNILYSGSSDKTIKIWDINNNAYTEMQPELNEQGTDIIAINSDGTKLAACGLSQSIALFDLTQKKFEKTLKVEKNRKAIDRYANDISTLAFSHKYSTILAAGLDGDGSISGQNINTVTIFNTATNDKDTLTGSMRELRHMAMNPHDAKELIVTSYRKVAFWDIIQKNCTQEVNNEYNNPYCVHDIAFHPDKNIFFTCTNEKNSKHCSYFINIWDTRERKIVKSIYTKGFGDYGVARLAIHPNGKEIIATGYRLTQILDFNSGHVIQTLPNKSSFFGECFCSSSLNSPKHNGEIKQVALSNDGKNLATVAGTIKIWDRN